ncbi:protein transport protein Sec16B isoform X1 [Osmerus eperlanus]|uniref:protein transport protein Sec16B isoform X1 n=1 Tax=Osmerus eperlanus TaxID=29151 RepID=UPI002E0F8793
MDPRGYQWRQSDPHSQRPKLPDDFHRPTPQGGGYYPPPDPRQRDRQWLQPDPRYIAPLTSPPPRPEYPPLYSSPQARAAYGHDRPEHALPRPHSRHGYDHPPQGFWNYREDYNHYDPSYYTGFYEYPDAGQWTSQESRKADPYHDRRYKQEHAGSASVEQSRYDHGRGGFQHDSSRHEGDQAGENSDDYGEAFYYNTGTLASSKTSGLSSSSYELSQYINGAETSDSAEMTANTERVVVPQVTAPLKYSLPHAVVSFGPAGQLVRVNPGLVTQGDPGLLEIHSLEVILGETQEQQEMRDFPGPLAREDLHKVDAISFALQRAEACMRDDKTQDRESATLLWNLLILLCRQNGRIVGSDIAELLLQNSSGACGPEPPTLIDLREDLGPDTEVPEGHDLLTGHGATPISEHSQQALEGYTKLLLAGRKKEALEAAMKTGLWGHALFLASKMDNRSYTTVLSRFTGQLAASDPLQTLFQLLSGRIPAVSTCCGNEKWGDWKPHLAVMLSNETEDAATHQKSIMTLGDTLSSRGLLHAAHVCYLTAGAPFGVYTSRTDKLVLLSSSHSLPFLQFSTNQAILCTELFEYCQKLGDKSFSIPSFQVYKFLYACRLLDWGLVSQAFHYCEVVGGALIGQHEPSLVLLGEVVKLAERLGHWERQLSAAAGIRPGPDPEWLRQLRLKHQGMQMGSNGWSKPQQHPADCSLAYEENTVYSEAGDSSDCGEVTGTRLSPHVDLLGSSGAEMEQAPIQQVFPSPSVMPDMQPAVPLVPLGGQDCSYHNAGGAHVRPAPLHPVWRDGPCGVNSGTETSFSARKSRHVTAKMHAGMPVTRYGHGQSTESAEVQPKHNTPSGWFSWFKSQPR